MIDEGVFPWSDSAIFSKLGLSWPWVDGYAGKGRSPASLSAGRPEASADQQADRPAIRPVKSFDIPVDWPGRWADCASKASAGTVLFTYWDLGSDMSVNPDKGRSDALRSMISDLGWGKGVACFWPVACPDASGVPVPDAEMFFRGVDFLCRPAAIAAFGKKAIEIVAGRPVTVFSSTIVQGGRTCLALPDVRDALGFKPLRDKTIALLAAAWKAKR